MSWDFQIPIIFPMLSNESMEYLQNTLPGIVQKMNESQFLIGFRHFFVIENSICFYTLRL